MYFFSSSLFPLFPIYSYATKLTTFLFKEQILMLLSVLLHLYTQINVPSYVFHSMSNSEIKRDKHPLVLLILYSSKIECNHKIHVFFFFSFQNLAMYTVCFKKSTALLFYFYFCFSVVLVFPPSNTPAGLLGPSQPFVSGNKLLEKGSPNLRAECMFLEIR